MWLGEEASILHHGVTCTPGPGLGEVEEGHLAETAGATVLAIDPYEQMSQQISNNVYNFCFISASESHGNFFYG